MPKDILYVVFSAVFLFLIQLVATVIITHFLKRWLEKRDRRQDKKDEARIEYEKVQLETTNASAKLSYALAMAWKRGEPNGEVEAGIDAYNKAMQKQTEFLQSKLCIQ